MIEDKDNHLRVQSDQINQLHGKVKRYVLMQDHLYKDYVKLENSYKEQLEAKEKALRQHRADLEDVSKRADNLQS